MSASLTTRLAAFCVALVLLRAVATALVLTVQQPLAWMADVVRAGEPPSYNPVVLGSLRLTDRAERFASSRAALKRSTARLKAVNGRRVLVACHHGRVFTTG